MPKRVPMLDAAPIGLLAVMCGCTAANLWGQARTRDDFPEPIGAWRKELIYDVEEFASWWLSTDKGHTVDRRAMAVTASEEYQQALEDLRKKRRDEELKKSLSK